MDKNHTLEAPHNDELKDIDQIGDKTIVSNVYRQANGHLKSGLLSTEERVEIKEAQVASISNTLWKSFIEVGLFIPYPIVSGSLFAALIYTYADLHNTILLGGIIIGSIIVWALTSYAAYSRVFKIFYKHALTAGPFLVTMLLSVFLVSQAAYRFVAESNANGSLLHNVAVANGCVLLYGVTASYVLLGIWGSRVRFIFKALCAFLLIALSAFFVAAVYYF